MKLSFKTWILFLLLACLGFGLWCKLGYSQFSFVDLAVDKKQAVKKAESYLSSLGVEPEEYSKAVVFDSDNWTDRYLQKTIGLKAEEEFIREHDYELFSWQVRFFKEMQKEEYIVGVSPKSGDVIGFQHLIEDIEPRRAIGKNVARKKAEDFLKGRFGLNLKEFDFHEEKVKRFDKRVDYSFSWEKKGVYIPWKEDQGQAKLLIGATVSGDEIRRFYKMQLDIPEKFQRYIANQLL